MKKAFNLFLALSFIINLNAQPDSLMWTPEFSMSLKTPRAVSISDDGKYIAYMVREALTEGKQSEFLNHIWVAAVDGSFNIQYTRGDKSCTLPAF